jgi:hypothetical protein
MGIQLDFSAKHASKITNRYPVAFILLHPSDRALRSIRFFGAQYPVLAVAAALHFRTT